MNKQPAYSKKVIEIADYMFKHPDKKMSDVLSCFVVKCHKNRRTVERYVDGDSASAVVEVLIAQKAMTCAI